MGDLRCVILNYAYQLHLALQFSNASQQKQRQRRDDSLEPSDIITVHVAACARLYPELRPEFVTTSKARLRLPS